MMLTYGLLQFALIIISLLHTIDVHSYNNENVNFHQQKYTYKKEFDPYPSDSYTKTLKRTKRCVAGNCMGKPIFSVKFKSSWV